MIILRANEIFVLSVHIKCEKSRTMSGDGSETKVEVTVGENGSITVVLNG